MSSPSNHSKQLNLRDLVDLLFAIAQRKKKCTISIDYNGETFTWKVSLTNMTIEDLPPAKP